MLTSNIEIQNTIIDIEVSKTETLSVYLDKDTGYLSIIKFFNPNTGDLLSLFSFRICGEFNQPIILPDSIYNLYISDKFNQPIILPDSLRFLKILGEFNQLIILPYKLRYLAIHEDFNQPIFFQSIFLNFILRNIVNLINQLYYRLD